jgi:hypothetical protein
MRGLLDADVPDNPSVKFRDLIETVDVRVYKTRGTNPERDIANLAQAATTAQPKDIADALLNFTKCFMSDSQFRATLEGEMYRNQGLHLMLMEYEEHLRLAANEPGFDVASLKALATTTPTVEHVLAQEPTFAMRPRGFADRDAYVWTSHQLGNLTLLEETLNSRARNKVPETKASDDKLYKTSAFRMVRQLGVQIQQTAGLWVKADVDTRTATLATFILGQWPLWKSA